MKEVLINEQRIQAEIDQIKLEFSDTKDIYREVCVLMFFRYGITPTANKLYQYVRKGSMSAPADALNKFWLDLREKSRVRIERSDIPEKISALAGDLIANLWNEAQIAAQNGFTELVDEASTQIQEYKLRAEFSNQKVKEIEELLILTASDLKNLQQKLSESEYKHTIDSEALADKEKSLKGLRNEKSLLETELKRVQGEFSLIADKLHETMAISDERYRALESKLLTEIDRERQRSNKLEKEMYKVNLSLKKARIDHASQIEKKEVRISTLRESIGILKGQLKESQRYQASAMKMLKKNAKA